MVRVVHTNPLDMITPYIEGYCLSSDSSDLPTGVCTGSKMTEVDTGKTYLFDEESKAWLEFPPSSDNGGT